jgi:lipocalin
VTARANGPGISRSSPPGESENSRSVFGLRRDYCYAVVGHPGRDYLWILSRTPQLDATIYGGILS